jgi:hypothetical membrane protein
MKINKNQIIENSPESFLIGSIIIMIGLTIPQIFFTGFNDEPYSLLNHFVSELGWIYVSELALFFNICLFIGGILIIPFMIYLRSIIKHNLMKLGSLVGMLSAIGCCFVAIFPMDIELLSEHALFATIFFVGSATMMVLFSLSILREKEKTFPRHFALIGVIVAFLNISLVIIDSNDPLFNMIEFNVQEYLISNIRPDFWLIAFIEWLIVLTTLFSLMMIALYAKKMKKKIVITNQ